MDIDCNECGHCSVAACGAICLALDQLDIADLMQCRCVCRQFRHAADDILIYRLEAQAYNWFQKWRLIYFSSGPTARHFPSLVVVCNQLFLFGGITCRTSLNDMWCADLADETTELKWNPVLKGREFPLNDRISLTWSLKTFISYIKGYLFLHGGAEIYSFNGHGPMEEMNDSFIMCLKTLEWKRVYGSMIDNEDKNDIQFGISPMLNQHVCTAISPNKILVLDGANSRRQGSDEAWIVTIDISDYDKKAVIPALWTNCTNAPMNANRVMLAQGIRSFDEGRKVIVTFLRFATTGPVLEVWLLDIGKKNWTILTVDVFPGEKRNITSTILPNAHPIIIVGDCINELKLRNFIVLKKGSQWKEIKITEVDFDDLDNYLFTWVPHPSLKRERFDNVDVSERLSKDSRLVADNRGILMFMTQRRTTERTEDFFILRLE
ncbi:hypothetical protein ACOME3_007960 [Neoechinorhynchus agilis]